MTYDPLPARAALTEDERRATIEHLEARASLHKALTIGNALRDSAYRAYSIKAGVPVAPARFHDLCGRLATLYADPDTNRDKITEILHILGI